LAGLLAVFWSSPESVRAQEDFFQKGLLLARESRFEEALDAFSRAIESRPDHAEAYNNRGAVHHYRKDYANAVEDYTRAIQLRPDSADFYNNRGASWLQRGAWEKAQSDFEKALDLGPGFAEAHKNLGMVLYLRSDYDGAAREYTRALELRPRAAEIFNNRGAAHYQKGSYFNALKDYTRAVELSPSLAEAYKNRGIVWFRMGHVEKAVEDFGLALQHDPFFADAYKNRGMAWYHAGRYNEALNDYIEALRLDPESPEVNNQLAWMLSVCPDPKYRNGSKALDLARKAVGLSESLATLDTLAAAHAEFGDFMAAAEIQEKVVALANGSRPEEHRRYLQRLEAYKDRRPWRSRPGAEKAHSYPASGVVTASRANIRSDPSIASEILAKLGRGETAALLWKEGEWYLIEINPGRWAYAHESVISSGPAAPSAGAAELGRFFVVGVDLARVREHASTDSAIIHRLRRGERVLSPQTMTDWHQVVLPDGRTGWVHKGLFIKNQ